MDTNNLPPETELEEAPEIFEKELDDILNNRATSWDKQKQQRFLLKMCIKELPAETDVKQILNTFLGKKKFKGKSVINNPSYVYDIDEEGGQRPVNLACKYGNSQVLEFLLDELNVCPARKNKFGDTALHSAILGAYTGQCNVQNALECTKLIIRNVRVLDILDRSNKTALCLAVSYNMPEIAKELVEAGAFVREYLRPQVLLLGLEKVDEVECPHLQILADIKDSLDRNDEQSFEKILRVYEVRSLNDGSEGFDRNLKNRINMLIRTAIENNMPGAIKLLLNCGTDINICFMNGTTLLHEAIELQRLDCIKILLEYDNCNVNARIQNNNESLRQCRAMIPRRLKKRKALAPRCVPIKETHGNFVSGDSALHLALKSGQTKVVKWLVGKDVDLFQANVHGYKPISLMTTKELRTYFDYRVRRGTDTDNIVTFDFNCLLLKEHENNRGTELEVLRTIASLEKHRSVLNHPLIRCFLYLKMTHVYWLYYLNFIFYALFTFFLTCLVLPDNNHWVPILVHYIFVAIFTAILSIREVIQISLGPATYFKLENLFENLLEVLIILTSTCILILFCFHSHGALWKVITSLGILFSYIEFMLMIGRHPRLATYITMFFKVSGSTLYFTIWYTPLIVAFSFIFFIFLHDKVETFQSIWDTVFKSIIMLTGEFEADDIWSAKNNVTDDNSNYSGIFDVTIYRGRVFFIFFIFFIAIVLVNLLNALAISDTNAVKEDAEILSFVSQIKFLYRIEVALSRKWVMNFSLSRKLLKQFRLLTNSTQNEEIKMAKEKIQTENGMFVNDVPLIPNNEIQYFNIDTFEKCTNLDYAIQKRLVFNNVQKLLFVQLLTQTRIQKINWLQKIWIRLKFLPPFEEILEDSLDLIHRNTNDSIEDRIKNLNIEDIHLKLKNIEKILLQLKHIENKVDASDIKMNGIENKLDALNRKISNV